MSLTHGHSEWLKSFPQACLALLHEVLPFWVFKWDSKVMMQVI
jgi:hypothetical protein